ncbi:MAG TPA: hypothetical protein VMZ29_05390 [Candidatus Bathyarchaeia archaeon]|nr:hypothetical protein [Candidatus Bathyarchaeia archaeon]
MFKKNSISKKSTASNKKEKLIEENVLIEVKQSLESISSVLNKTSAKLPSLVSTRGIIIDDINGLLQDKFKIDSEIIIMLEEFFTKLVLLLKYRSSYDEKLSKISRQIKKLKVIEKMGEFKGNLQLLGITLQETEQIVKNYENMYNILFTEQALLQFQLMEQLSMFRERDVPDFSEMFNLSVETFFKINEKISSLKE